MAKAADTSPKSKQEVGTAAHDHDHDHAHDHDHDHAHDHDDDHDGQGRRPRRRPRATPAPPRRASGSARRAATIPARAARARSTRSATSPPTSRRRSRRPTAPDAKELLTNGWRLFEQRRPGAAEKEFRAALAVDASLQDAHVGIGMARLSAGNADGAKEELSAVLAAGESRDGQAARRRARRTPSASRSSSLTSARRTRSAASPTTRSATRTR